MFKLGIITDEMSQNLDKALAFSKEMGLECFELRSAWEKDPFEYSGEDFKEIKRLSDKYGLPLASISSPFYKCLYSDKGTREKHIEGLKRLADKAEMLGVNKIRCFDFFREDGVGLADIAEAFAEPISICKDFGITLMIESEPSANSFNSEKTAEIVRYINNPAVRALYEPGNNLYSDTDEVPFPDGFMFVKDIFCHIHIKDAIRENGKTTGVAIGSGEVDYEGMFRELLRISYEGAVVLEPHYKIGGSIPDELLRNPKGSIFSKDGFIACRECIIAVQNILDKIIKG